MSQAPGAAELGKIYRLRFEKLQDYRRKVWDVLTASFFSRYIGAGDAVLDLGCGWGEFISSVRCGKKLAMDLNPDAAGRLGPGVRFLHQDSSRPWPLADGELDAVFTSNYFEHLPDKSALGRTLSQAFRCLKPGGRLIALGPNIKLVPGAYWDFWDHSIPLTELSLSEALKNAGFAVAECRAAFLPYTMSDGRRYPLILLKAYLALPWAWRFFGKQFLVVAQKPS